MASPSGSASGPAKSISLPQPGCQPPAAGFVALSSLRSGQVAIVTDAQLAADDGAMLRAMGLVTGATVRVCRTGEPCIVAVMHTGAKASCSCGGSRIGLASNLAKQILVRVSGSSDGPEC